MHEFKDLKQGGSQEPESSSGGFERRFGEFLWVEIRPDAWDLFASVKIEMNLAER